MDICHGVPLHSKDGILTLNKSEDIGSSEVSEQMQGNNTGKISVNIIFSYSILSGANTRGWLHVPSNIMYLSHFRGTCHTI
jgi:hypothetical protein